MGTSIGMAGGSLDDLGCTLQGMSLGDWLQEQLFERRIVLVDAADTLRSELRVFCRGQIGGPAIAVVAVAGRRTSAPHARFHLTQPTGRFTGTPEQIATQSRQQQELLWKLYALLARRTGQPAEEIAEDIRRGRYFDAQEALAYRLIDEIMTGE